MEDEEHAHYDAYFQEELYSLKVNMAHIASLLEQTLGNTSSEGSSNQPVTLVETQATIQPKERMGE
jgi:hypothetical protein